MTLEGLVLFCLLSLVDSGFKIDLGRKVDSTMITRRTNLDSDVEREEKSVAEMYAMGNFGDMSLAVHKLRKMYGTLPFVKGISFTVPPKVGLQFAIGGIWCR